MAQPVFVLHAPDDQEMAHKVASHLEAHGIPSICDRKPGKDNGEEEESIILLVLSQNANDDDEILREMARAIATSKVLIPFRIENFRASGEMEDYLRWRYVHEAFSPPLEKHLEELVRMIKPLLHGRSPRLSEATSISRTLPSRAAILRKPFHAEGGSQSGIPVQVQLFFPHPIVADIATTIECTLENTSAGSLTTVQVFLECRGFKREAACSLDELPPGGNQRLIFEIVPGGFGQFDLWLTVQYQSEERITSFCGIHSVRILEAPAADEFPGILQQFSQALGVTLGTQRSYVALPSSIASSDDLARFKLPEHLEPLDLARDYAVSIESLKIAKADHSLEIPDEFLPQAQTGTVLQLTPVDNADADPHQAIRLVSRPHFVLGRSGEESDFVLWFWPRNEIHDTKTRRISKKHVTFSLAGSLITIHNTAAGSLTTYDGQDVSATGSQIQRRGTLNLSGIYLLDVRHFPPSRATLRISNLNDWKGASSAASTGPALGSVRMSPRTSGVLPQNATWLLSDATFGSSQVNPVILPGMADIQGRFHHAHGAFWLEALADDGAIQLDTYALSTGSLVPVRTGQILRIGAIIYSVSISA